MPRRFLRSLLFCLVALVVSPVLPTLQAGDPTPAIIAVAALSDPAKLATLKGQRAANDRLPKVLAWLEEARRAGMIPSKTIDEAQKITGDSREHAAVVKEMLLRNFVLCERSAVFTPENLARMKQGRSPLVTSGTYVGQAYEVDHVIPVDDFPELGNELANLLYLPRTLNRRKSDEIKQLALDLSQRLSAAGVIKMDDPARLHRIRQDGGHDSTASRKTNLNRAAASTLEKLPGIGPKTAAAIIAARPLKDFKDLDKIPGIGPKTIEGLRELVEF